jgi:hypothetical protein
MLEQILSRLVKTFFENDIASLVKIQIYSNSIFMEIKNQENFVKRLEQILSRLVIFFSKMTLFRWLKFKSIQIC